MSNSNDYQITNLQAKELKLRQQQNDILTASSEKSLDILLDNPAPATLVQSFPDQDLYYLMHKIGPDDFVPVLAMAQSSQWEYILDMEIWQADRLELAPMTRILDLLFQADPQRLLRWGIIEKTSLFELYLSRHIQVRMREHDEPPPEDFDDYISLDEKFYFRFPELPTADDDDDDPKALDSEDTQDLIEKMLNLVADMDLSVYHGLLQEVQHVSAPETEEEEFRLKNVRLAEKGFLPFHEAVGIYQPAALDNLRKRPQGPDSRPYLTDPDDVLPPQFFNELLPGDNLFVKAIRRFEAPFSYELQSEVAALINEIIAADHIRLRTSEDLEKAIHKACAYLNLGLEKILNSTTDDPVSLDAAATMIQTYFIEDIFRTGSRAGIQLKTQAVKWYKQSFTQKKGLPLGFFDEYFLGVLGGLLIERPMFHDPGSGRLYRDFSSLEDIRATRDALAQIMALDHFTAQLDPALSNFEEGLLTYKTMLLTFWAKSRLDLPMTLEPIGTQDFGRFFSALFDQKVGTDQGKKDIGSPESTATVAKAAFQDFASWISEACQIPEEDMTPGMHRVIQQIMGELRDEYGAVPPSRIDPRFMPHFLLKKDR